MRQFDRFAAVSLIALALAACGAPEDEAEDTGMGMEEVGVGDDGMVAADAEPAGAGDAEETSDVSEEPDPEASASPTPSPSATPTPTPVASMEPPPAFTTCGVCHSVEPGENGIGPTLAGVAGRRAAAVAGFTYSPAMRSANLTWNDATLDRFLADPAGVVPGTTMALPGLSAADRAAVIAYMKTL